MIKKGKFSVFMTPSEVAKRLGVSPITVRSWVNKGWLVSTVTPGGHRRFLWKDVEQFKAKRLKEKARETVCRILVVDDDAHFRAFMIEALAILIPDAEIREAVDGFQAGTAVAEFRPDLVMLDYSMPGMNGASVCRQIKSSEIYSSTRVIAMTGYADLTIQAELKDAGADGLLPKPVSIDVIEGILKKFDFLPMTNPP